MDIAKGIGILIIVYGHSWFVATSLDLMYPILASFILPLFFFLSGVLFKPEQPFGEMAVRKADGLLKLLEALDDNDDVQRVTANFEVSEAVLARLAG